MTLSNLNFNSQYETEQPLDNNIKQLNQTDSALPLSKRISSIFNEFIIGMKLAQHHDTNQSFDINILASHNLRLLHKRLEQTTEYAELLHQKKLTDAQDDQLWQSLFKENEITCGFINMPAFQNLPCYNHPGMNSLYLVLSGQTQLKQYSLIQKNSESAAGQPVNNMNNMNNQIKMKELSLKELSEGAAVYFQTNANSMASLSTAENECLLLNIQLSKHYDIH